MTEQRITTEEAERIAADVEQAAERLWKWDQWGDEAASAEGAAYAIRSLAAERDALREAMETATDCCARAIACGRILRDALGENQP